MAQYIFTMNRVGKIVPPKRFILRDISLSFFPGAKIGVLGLNGSGKSTLLKIMAGVDTEFEGEARPQPGIKIGYLAQEPALDPNKNVRAIVEEGVADQLKLVQRFNEISDKFAEPVEDEEMNRLLEEQGKLQDAIDAVGGWELERKLEIAADALRLPPWDAGVQSLSGGERRRVALCRLLLSNPDMLLLDEPTNHLDAESVAWLERFLKDFPGTVIAVTHDRYFLDNVAGWILELDRGHGIPWQGNYTSWLEQKDQRLALEEKQEIARQRTIKTELEWVRTNPGARRAKAKARLARFEELGARFAEPLEDDEMNRLLEEQARLQDEIDAAGAWELDRRIEVAMDALRVPSGDTQVSTLSGGERRRVALCRLLLSKPDLLLLDEPTNHLDAESVAWLERFLKEYPGTVVAVTHDRYFLDNVAGWILELDRGRGIPWEGNYSSWLEQKQRRLEVEEKQASARQRTLARELEWVRMAPRARQAKGKARFRAYEALVAEGEQRQVDSAEIAIPSGPRLGDVVLEADHLCKAYGDRLLVDDLSFALPPGGIVGVIGANGAGKTTLFRMIVGQEKADAGELRLGKTVKLAYVDQSRDALDAKKTVWQEISGGEEKILVGGRELSSRAYVSSFNFKGSDQQKLLGMLSGGERNRVHLAKTLQMGGNLLLLDEPTNDLDVDTLRALEEALVSFPGCAVVISHDRWFLDRIATHILAFEGDSHVEWFEGNYQDYEKDRKRRLGADADQPHRIKYRRIDA
jgi:ATP-binding cassette ChvD family protein